MSVETETRRCVRRSKRAFLTTVTRIRGSITLKRVRQTRTMSLITIDASHRSDPGTVKTRAEGEESRQQRSRSKKSFGSRDLETSSCRHSSFRGHTERCVEKATCSRCAQVIFVSKANRSSLRRQFVSRTDRSNESTGEKLK